ncbi:RagB/SusD family nutrient uptake outer membrane protein [Parabacteroides johnsonii]|uniref:RagB/SusD family nutrient uptake outer membrane protein n=1 Tax=Parabacteroides johnsonii TaxID=387661 RepID=UPI003079D00C
MRTLYLYLLVVCCTLQSCSSFLEETPYNKITAGNFFTTAKEAEQGVNGLYFRLRELYRTGYILYMCEAPTDIWKSARAMDVEFRTWTIDATSGSVSKLWNNCYISINQANAIIKALENNEIPDLADAKRAQFLGEAKFIRAHFYYHLVQQYGDVELRTEPTESLITEAYKTPAAEIWNFIIDELNFCVENLPQEQSVYGRITREAAKHHLARVYLTVKRSDKDVSEAKRLSEEVIASSAHSLMNSHKDLWSTDNIRNSEVLFPILFTQNTELNGSGNELHTMFTASYSDHYPNALVRDLTYGRPWSRIRPTYYLQELYDETKDARWEDCYRTFWRVNKEEATDMVFSPYSKKSEEVVWKKGDSVMIIPKHPWTKEQVKAVWPVWVWMPDEMREELQDKVQSETNPNGEWPSNTKFQSGTMYTTLIKLQDPLRPSANEMKGVRDIVVFRLGETYLLAAEACHLLGDNKKAAEYINVIRKRAALPGKEKEMEITADRINIDFILDERAREMAGEFCRWYDLKRTGKLYERMNNPDMNEIVAGKFQEYHVLRPIPRDQLTRISNPEDFPQNEGYGN